MPHDRHSDDRSGAAAVAARVRDRRILAGARYPLRDRLDLSVRRARIRGQVSRVLSRLAVSLRRPALVGRENPGKSLGMSTRRPYVLAICLVATFVALPWASSTPIRARKSM